MHKITDEERTEIMPEVYMSMGFPTSANGSPSHRLAIEAPRSIKITRLPTERRREDH